MKNELEKSEMTFVNDIKKIIQDGRNAAYSAVSSVMIQTYWNIGKRIVEQEQNGKTRAEYGTHLIYMLAEELTKEFGKNFSRRNLFYYRKFYEYFPNQEIVNACVHNLTWTHYRELLRVLDENARLWYLKELSEQNWASRTLDRNIATQYYYRLLQSSKKEKVIAYMKEKTCEYQAEKFELLKNPIVAEFLGFRTEDSFSETELESAILSHIRDFLLKNLDSITSDLYETIEIYEKCPILTFSIYDLYLIFDILEKGSLFLIYLEQRRKCLLEKKFIHQLNLIIFQHF